MGGVMLGATVGVLTPPESANVTDHGSFPQQEASSPASPCLCCNTGEGFVPQAHSVAVKSWNAQVRPKFAR